MKVYIICLKSTYEKRCKPTLESWYRIASKSLLNLEIVHVDATTPADFELEDVVHPYTHNSILKKRRNTTDILGSDKECACYLSHLKIWNMIVASQEPGIVVEDDGNRDVKQGLQRLDQLQKKPLNTDIYLLEHAPIKFQAFKYNNDYLKVNRFVGAMFYYIDLNACTRLIRYSIPLVFNVDTYMSSCIQSLDLNIYTKRGNALSVSSFITQHMISSLGKNHYSSALINISVALVILTLVSITLIVLYTKAQVFYNDR